MNHSRKSRRVAPRFAYEGLDRAIHERARLGVLTCLLVHPDGLSFPAIKESCGLTDGNLSRHLEVLESAGLVEVTKAQETPRTSCRLTTSGRKRFLSYLAVLQQVLSDANRREARGGRTHSLPKLT